MLRHPATLAAVAAYAALWTYEVLSTGHRGRYPVLQDEDRYTQMPLFLLAAGALIAAHLTATRTHRHGAEPLCEVLTLPLWRRSLAHFFAVLPLAGVAAVLTTTRITYYALAPTAVGSPSLIELVTGPIVVLLAGCTGVALARFTPAAVAGPFAALLIGALVLCSALGIRGMKWLGPLGVENEFAAPLPTGLMDRPALIHLGYLIALTGVLVLLTLIRSGLRTIATRSCLLLVAASAILIGTLQYQSPSASLLDRRADAERHPGDQQRCRTAGPVTFCAFPDFLGRTADWEQVTGGILNKVPLSRQAGPYGVRQRLFFAGDSDGIASNPPLKEWAQDDSRHNTPGAVTVGTRWGKDEISASAVLSFAVRFADRVAVDSIPKSQPQSLTLCHARAVTVLWLAAQATPETADALRSLSRRSIGGITLPTLNSSDSVSVNGPEVQIVLDLLDRPAKEIADRLNASWSQLTDQRTNTTQAARLLGVTSPTDTRQDSEGTPCAAR
ncbi:hypothetical protein [Streptomyces albipurpureus]|uniref:ABC transporter permease n=1 Tax=Streptomyces albipurpureus TaxID=2897419 RepID=A0ABT0UKF9_9ACTN|nr:hypothetical protein [Streptomyces sp. CWNU-1]MCM2388919.1 hypothetical protein [Streptomyces sp. CWNU-1]